MQATSRLWNSFSRPGIAVRKSFQGIDCIAPRQVGSLQVFQWWGTCVPVFCAPHLPGILALVVRCNSDMSFGGKKTIYMLEGEDRKRGKCRFRVGFRQIPSFVFIPWSNPRDGMVAIGNLGWSVLAFQRSVVARMQSGSAIARPFDMDGCPGTNVKVT